MKAQPDPPAHTVGGACQPPSKPGGFTPGIMWCCPTCKGLWYATEHEWKFLSRPDQAAKPPLVLPTEACVIRAKVAGPVPYRILFGHPNPGEPEGMTFCRAVDGLGYKGDEIESFEVLWVDDPERRA